MGSDTLPMCSTARPLRTCKKKKRRWNAAHRNGWTSAAEVHCFEHIDFSACVTLQVQHAQLLVTQFSANTQLS
jgi:hypothetical protein